MIQGMPSVIAIVLNWNKPRETLACINALSQQYYSNFNIIVVDNGSADEQLSLPCQSPVRLTLLRSAVNLGFAGGVNIGINRALSEGADYVWLVNNDAMPNVDVLSRLIMAMKSDTRVGLASPMILNADAEDEVEFCGGLWTDNVFQTTNDLSTYRQWYETVPDQIWLVGTALLLSRSIIETIGLFNEKLFAYWEDNDYSVRCIRAGFRNIVVTEASVRHWSGRPQAAPEIKPTHYHYYMARNEILFIQDNIALARRIKPLIWAVKKQLRKMSHLKMPQEAINAISIGLWDGFRSHGGAFRAGRRPPSIVQAFLRKMAKLCCG